MKKIFIQILSSAFALLMSIGTMSAQTELIVDGGFETGPTGTAWLQTSTNFGTPLCDLAGCGTGTGTGPHAGNFWAWFGGISGTVETGTLEQSFVIPAGGTANLTFWLEQIICDGPTDFLDVQIDGTTIFSTDGASLLCGVLGYTQISVNLDAYADGNSHTLLFTSTTFSVNGGNTNIFVDDVSVIHNSGGPSCITTTTFSGLSVAIPDDDPLGVTDAQTVSGISGTALGNDVKLSSVCFQITHTWVGDLIVTLIAPNGASVILLDRPGVPTTIAGCAGDDIDACVQLGTGNEMESVCANLPAISGSYTAANGLNLNAINSGGGSPNGSWQLFASDNAGLDTGTIIEWSLSFDNGPVANWTSPGTVCATGGAINLNNLLTGTAGGTWTGTGVTGNTFDPAGLSGPISIEYSVTDAGSGCSDSQTNIIEVISGAPVASFTNVAVSLTVNFTNTSTGGVTYLWDFGDSNTSTDMNPSHTYATAGTYTVTLTTTNACGSNVTTQQITIQGCPDLMVDGSFETGGVWIEFSSNFGTPVCDLAGCGNGTGTGPRTGNNWSWFGGIAAFEEGSMTQTITIPVNSTANLNFWLEQIICDGPDDFLKVAIDADTVYTTTGGSTLCGVLGYSLQTVNLDAYADGLPHTLQFFSRIYGLNGNGTNFFVDDVSLIVCTNPGFAESNLNQHIQLMPVPAKDFVEIRFSDIVTNNVTIEVADMVGKNVYTSVITNVNDDQSERIDISSWSKGVYMVKISAAGNTAIRKIVVQ